MIAGDGGGEGVGQERPRRDVLCAPPPAPSELYWAGGVGGGGGLLSAGGWLSPHSPSAIGRFVDPLSLKSQKNPSPPSTSRRPSHSTLGPILPRTRNASCNPLVVIKACILCYGRRASSSGGGLPLATLTRAHHA